MTLPKVSIIIPAYNRGHLIDITLRTAINQTYRGSYEIVVVDDGSTDDTAAVVRSVAPGARYIYQDNVGIPEVLNRCVAHARGEYIAFLGSDDALVPEALERQAAVLDANPAVGIVHGAAWLIDGDGRLLRIEKPRFATGDYVRSGRDEIGDLLMSNHIVATTVMVRKRCFDECGPFDRRFSLYEDWNMWTRILKQWDIGYLNEPLAYYRVHTGQAGSIFRMAAPRILEANRRLHIEAVLADPDVGARYAHLRHRAYARHHNMVAVRALDEGHWWYGRSQAVRAIAANPVDVRSGASNLALLARSLLPRPVLRIAKRARHGRDRASSARPSLRLTSSGTLGTEG